jgi:hypothetical protein
MKRWQKWLLLALVGLAGLVVAALLLLQRWVGSDDFRHRVQVQAQEALGVPVVLGRLHIDPWPVPAVALDGVDIQTRPALTAVRIEMRLRLHALLSGRLEVASLLVRGAELPQPGIDALLTAIEGKDGHGTAGTGTAGAAGGPTPGQAPPLLLLPRRLVLEDVTWRNSRGAATTFDADMTVGMQGLPEVIQLKVHGGMFQGARAKAALQAGAASAKDPGWDIHVDHAGGTIDGVLTVSDPLRGGKEVFLRGTFETRNLELAALRKGAVSVLTGRLRASTTASARAASAAGLSAALTTQSQFTVKDAVVNGIDLAKAVATVGLSRGGQTRLDTLSGQLRTRGKAIQLGDLVARSGALSATGDVAVAPDRALSGRIRVDLGANVVGKAVGVPLVVGGTLDAPTVTLTRGAMLGAAIGTLVMPGVGTGAGASIGDAIGYKLKGLFGK